MSEGFGKYHQPHHVEDKDFDASFTSTRMMINKQQEYRASSAFGMSTDGIPPPPDTIAMKEQRKQSTVVAGILSGVAGLLIGGPIVGVVAGFTCAVITKKNLKKKEKKMMTKYQKELAELLSPPSPLQAF